MIERKINIRREETTKPNLKTLPSTMSLVAIFGVIRNVKDTSNVKRENVSNQTDDSHTRKVNLESI